MIDGISMYGLNGLEQYNTPLQKTEPSLLIFFFKTNSVDYRSRNTYSTN